MSFLNSWERSVQGVKVGTLGVPSSLKLRSECNFCWERGKAEASSSALLSKKGGGREGSIEGLQTFDFFCSDIMPYRVNILGYFDSVPKYRVFFNC